MRESDGRFNSDYTQQESIETKTDDPGPRCVQFVRADLNSPLFIRL